ncbi:MAG: hypothetical protein NC485_14000 [Ruminococcus flavefaciens]|nr:hypothetical protein [Ruminococcus flavefaciens]
MKKACQYCGGIHDKKYICNKKPERGNKLDRFRWSYDWKIKRIEVMKRDRYLCRACLNNLPGTVGRLCNVGLSVHHEMAENSEISVEKLLKCIPPEYEI